MNVFHPDLIIAIGGGSPMDAAKMMWIQYEHPGVCFKELALRFMDIRKRVYKFPKMGVKAQLVCIPTTSGTGSEVTPFAVMMDDSTGIKYPIADYALTPNMAIVDSNLVMHMPKSLTATGGFDAVVHALEAYVSVFVNEYTDGQALQALKLLKEYLPHAYLKGAGDPIAREKVHNAATIAGIAFSNTFLGVCHGMAHKVRLNFTLSFDCGFGGFHQVCLNYFVMSLQTPRLDQSSIFPTTLQMPCFFAILFATVPLICLPR